MTGRSRGVLALAAALACGRVSDDTLTDASADATAPNVDDASSGFDSVELLDATSAPEAAPPPVVACVDAGDAGAMCPLPPSTCLDGEWLEYFDNGACAGGTCQYETLIYACNLGCVDSGCVDLPKTPNSPNGR